MGFQLCQVCNQPNEGMGECECICPVCGEHCFNGECEKCNEIEEIDNA